MSYKFEILSQNVHMANGFPPMENKFARDEGYFRNRGLYFNVIANQVVGNASQFYRLGFTKLRVRQPHPVKSSGAIGPDEAKQVLGLTLRRSLAGELRDGAEGLILPKRERVYVARRTRIVG